MGNNSGTITNSNSSCTWTGDTFTGENTGTCTSSKWFSIVYSGWCTVQSASCECGACAEDDTQQCGTNVGACEYGTRSCVDGIWGACIGGIVATTEICGDGIDNDCDGQIDEGCGGGGGGLPIIETKSFSVDPGLIEIKLNPLEKKTRSITITNTGDLGLLLSIKVLNLTELEEFILLSNDSVVLGAGESITIYVNFSAEENIELGSYSGQLEVSGDSLTEKINLTFEIIEEIVVEEKESQKLEIVRINLIILLIILLLILFIFFLLNYKKLVHGFLQILSLVGIGKSPKPDLFKKDSRIPKSINKLALVGPRNIAKSRKFYNAGAGFYQKKDYSKALKEFQRSVEFDNKFWQGYQGIGNCCLAKGKTKEAISSYEKSLSINPKNTELTRWLIHKRYVL